MRLNKLLPMLFLFPLIASAQEPCKVETKYDKFTDTTEAVCTVQKVGALDINAIAIYHGKQGTEDPRYNLTFVYLEKVYPEDRWKLSKADTLYILSGEWRRQVPLVDYQHSQSPPLNGKVLRIERATAWLDQEALSRIKEGKSVEIKLGDAEIELTTEAVQRLRDFTTQVEALPSEKR